MVYCFYGVCRQTRPISNFGAEGLHTKFHAASFAPVLQTGAFFIPICTFCVDSYCIPINSILFSYYTIQHEVEENEEP